MIPSSYRREDADRALSDFDDYAADVLRSDRRTILGNLKTLIALQRRDPLFVHLFEAELKPFNFDSWYHAMHSTIGRQIGRGTLHWPDDRREKLYLQTVLLTKIADGDIDLLNFCYDFISSDNRHEVVFATFNRQLTEQYLREYRKLAVQIATSFPSPPPERMPEESADLTDTEIEVFISHSSRDEDLARVTIELLRAALSLNEGKIRCTSVEGYKLPAGVDSDQQIRVEVLKSRVLIGLLTPHSLESSYVLFELGARWGRGGFIAPLLAKGSTGSVLRGPIAGFNALHADKEGDLKQFVADLAMKLGVVAAEFPVYGGVLKQVVQTSLDGDLFKKYEGRRVKMRSEFRKEQYYVRKRRIHYLTPEAASVCDECGLHLELIEENEERILSSSFGETFDAALMRGALKK